MHLQAIAIFLCLIAGAAIDTGSVCTLRAVNEALSGRATTALGLLTTLLVASAVFFVDVAMGWQLRAALWSWPTLVTIAGAGLVGIGTVVNGACAVGTVTRLCRGDIGYAATFAGGIAISLLVPRQMLPAVRLGGGETEGVAWLVVVLLVAVLPMLILRSHMTLRGTLAYVLLGLVAAVLTNLQGDWTWLQVAQNLQAGIPVPYELIACLIAVLAGATAMAIFRGKFRLMRPDPATMLREAIGGGLMAVGAVMIPGGTGMLLVYGVPSGSPHAVFGYVIVVVVLIVLLRGTNIVRRWGVWPIP